MPWNWQQPDWPHFTWRPSRLAKAEERFVLGSGVLLGTVTHLGTDQNDQVTVEAMSDEAVTTSQIEGEVLDRDSVQSSIRRQLGLAADARRVKPAERGIGELMVDLYHRFAEPLDHAIYEQASVKPQAGRFRDRSNHLSGVASGTRHLTGVRSRPHSPGGLARRRPWRGRGPTFDPAFFLTLVLSLMAS